MSQLISSTIDKEIIKKKNQYMDYIEEHRNNVKKAYEFISEKIIQNCSDNIILTTIDSLKEEIESHDESKYSSEEFDAYRRKFFPTSLEQLQEDENKLKEMEEEFEKAWLHHFSNNDHHPKFWCYVKKEDGKYVLSKDKLEPLDMNLSSILHMICDWEAMSIKFNGYTIDWYIHKATDERKCMSTNTIRTVEKLLRIIYSYEGDFNYDE